LPESWANDTIDNNRGIVKLLTIQEVRKMKTILEMVFGGF